MGSLREKIHLSSLVNSYSGEAVRLIYDRSVPLSWITLGYKRGERKALNEFQQEEYQEFLTVYFHYMI
jgi:hypothetical protein